MEISQLLPCVIYGDAIGNHALTLMRLLRSWGYESHIYAEDIHPRLVSECRPIREFKPTEASVTFYHYAFRSEAAERFLQAPGKRALIYHNITPHQFFRGYHEEAYRLNSQAREALVDFRHVDLALGDSAYNCEELQSVGFRDPKVMPILVDFSDFDRTRPSIVIQNQYDDGWTNFLFVGRVAPNKRHEDAIHAFAHYNRFVDRRSRLLLVGGYTGFERYLEELRRLVDSLGLADHVVFSGHTTFDKLVAYYRIADLFLCMSEHEGFCVPLLEAMYHDLPVVAYKSTAIPETLGDAGVLIQRKEVAAIAEAMHLLVSDRTLRAHVVRKQRERLEAFRHEVIAAQFKQYLQELLA